MGGPECIVVCTLTLLFHSWLHLTIILFGADSLRNKVVLLSRHYFSPESHAFGLDINCLYYVQSVPIFLRSGEYVLRQCD
jgi:hypothetical protein